MRVISGKCRGVKLDTPKGMETRPTTERVKEALFSALQFEIAERIVLDLFAGSGQLGIEALSRGAKSAVFVDAGKDAISAVKANLKRTGLETVSEVYFTDSLQYLKKCNRQFSLIFLDPPYAETLLEDAIKQISVFDILAPNGIIVTERPKEKVLNLDGIPYNRGREYGFGVSRVMILRNDK